MLTTPPEPRLLAVTVIDRAFYEELGARIATLRKARGLTQVQLAAQLGVAQQTLAHYEAGRLRLLAGAIPKLAELLAVPVDVLLGDSATAPRKRGPAPRLQQQLEQLQRLPKAKQRFVTQMLDSVLAQASQ